MGWQGKPHEPSRAHLGAEVDRLRDALAAARAVRDAQIAAAQDVLDALAAWHEHARRTYRERAHAVIEAVQSRDLVTLDRIAEVVQAEHGADAAERHAADERAERLAVQLDRIEQALDVNVLAATIRRVDPTHTLGAAALAEAIIEEVRPRG